MRGVGSQKTRKDIDRRALFSASLPAGSSIRYKILKRTFSPWWPRYERNKETAADNQEHIFLTFDDGPNPGVTNKIAEILEAGNHRATFFVVGKQALRHPEIVRSLDAAGHSIGSHSARHLDWGTASLVDRFSDYVQGHRQVEEVLGHKCKFFRPPHSRFDLCSLAAAVFLRAKFVLYSSDSLDWQQDSTQHKAYENAWADLTAGSIALFHDNIMDNPLAADRSHTIAAVEKLIESIEHSGWIGKAL